MNTPILPNRRRLFMFGTLLVPGVVALAYLHIFAATTGWHLYGRSAEATVIHSAGAIYLPALLAYFCAIPWAVVATVCLVQESSYRSVFSYIVLMLNIISTGIASIPTGDLRALISP